MYVYIYGINLLIFLNSAIMKDDQAPQLCIRDNYKKKPFMYTDSSANPYGT